MKCQKDNSGSSTFFLLSVLGQDNKIDVNVNTVDSVKIAEIRIKFMFVKKCWLSYEFKFDQYRSINIPMLVR